AKMQPTASPRIQLLISKLPPRARAALHLDPSELQDATHAGALSAKSNLPATASRERLGNEPTKYFESALQGRLAGGVGDAEVSVATAKDAAGNDEELVLDGIRDELLRRSFAGRDPGENVEGSAGVGDFVAGVAQAVDDHVAALGVRGGLGAHIN